MMILLFVLSAQLHGQNSCAASCALLQSSRATNREIKDEAKLSGFDTILINVLGPIRAQDLNDAQNECVERARRYTWWTPTGERVEPVLYDDLHVFKSGEVNIVVSWTRQAACR